MAADLAMLEQLQAGASADEEAAGDGGGGNGSEVAPTNEFLAPDADFGKTGVAADLEQQEKYVADFFDNVRPRSKWAVRVYSKIAHLIQQYYEEAMGKLINSATPAHVVVRIESDATPSGHRTQAGWGLSIDRAAKAMLLAVSASWLMPMGEESIAEDAADRRKVVGEWVEFDLPAETQLLLSNRLNKTGETEIVFDTLARVMGLRKALQEAVRPVEVLIALDSASSNVAAAHLVGEWMQGLNSNVLVNYRYCSLHGLNKVVADACQLACGSLGYALKNVEKRLFLTSRLYGSQSNAINEAVDSAVKLGKLQTDAASVLDESQLGAYRQFVQMFQLLDFEAAGAAEIFPSAGKVFVLEPLDGWLDLAGERDTEKLAEAGEKVLHKVFSKPTNPSMTRFATAAVAAAEQVHMYIYQNALGGSLAWEAWRRQWASPHIGGGTRFTFEEDEKEYRCVCAVIAICAYAANRLQKRIMNKAARASWREMWQKFRTNLGESLALGRSAVFWRLLGLEAEEAAPFIAAIELACLAQLATTEHQIITRFMYDRMMEELHGAAASQWRSIIEKHRSLVGLQIRYNDATERSVARVSEIAARHRDTADFSAFVRGLIESWLAQSRSTLRVEQLHARYQAHLKGLFWRSVAEASQHLLRVSLRAARRAAAAATLLQKLIERPRKKRGVDIYASQNFSAYGLASWRKWATDLNDGDRKYYNELAGTFHVQALADYERATAAAAAKDEASKFTRAAGAIRKDFYDALENYVRTRWPSVSVEKAQEARIKYCERRVPTLLPGTCQVVGDSSTGLRKRLGQMVKSLNPGSASHADPDTMQHLEEEFLPDGDCHVVHEPPAKPPLLKSLARVLLVEYGDPFHAPAELFGGPAVATSAFLVLSVSLSPLNFWGIELDEKLGGGWKIPDTLEQVRTVSGNMLCDVVGERIFLATIDDKNVAPIGGELLLRETSKSASSTSVAGASASLGRGTAGDLDFESTAEWEACLLEQDETKARDKLDKLMALMESQQPAAKRRKEAADLAAPAVRPGLEVVRDVVSSSSSSTVNDNKKRVRVADLVPILVLTDQERKELDAERTKERHAAAVTSYRIKSGDSKFTDKMIQAGTKKKDTKKRVIEPTKKADIRKYLAAKWLFHILGNKSMEFSITSAASADDVRHVLNAWACRHAFATSCIRGETVETLQGRTPDAERGNTVEQQWGIVLDGWKATHDRVPTDQTLRKKLLDVEKLPDDVKNRLSPLASEEDDALLPPPDIIDELPALAQPPLADGDPAVGGAFVEDQEDDLLA
eukprot:g18175.t1